MNQQQLLRDFEDWFYYQRSQSRSEDNSGIIANLLQVLEQLKSDFDLDYTHYPTKNGTQLKGIGGSNLAKVLALFDEQREFLKEGGRTSRGGPPAVERMLKLFENLIPNDISESWRNGVLIEFQKFLVERVREILDREKIKLVFHPTLSTWQTIHNLLLDSVKSRKKVGHIAQHLVGAKLQFRFPDLVVSNESASTADKPTNRSGDFEIGSTVFHVTVSPMEGVYKKCQENIKEGLKVYLIVPDAKLAAARQLGEQYCNGQIAIESLESFVSQNIEEISVFSADKLKHSLVSLVKIYNERVNAVEVDKSLMIELPSNLEKYNI